jgi:hypothetical protein
MELGSYNQSLETSREGPRDVGVENRDVRTIRMPPLGTLNTQIANGRCASDISGLTDASALLWRLQLRNVVVGWRQLADRWDDADWHAALYVVHGYRIRQIALWSGLRRRVLIEADFPALGLVGLIANAGCR